MALTTFTAQGHIAIPTEIQQYLNLIPNCQVELIIDANGEVKLIPLNVAVQSLSGILCQQAQPNVSVEDMNQSIQEQISDRFGY